MECKGRGSYRIQVDNNVVLLDHPLKGQISFSMSDISETQLKRSPYDIPFLEKSVVIRLQSGKKYSIKRVRKSCAEQLYQTLIRRA